MGRTISAHYVCGSREFPSENLSGISCPPEHHEMCESDFVEGVYVFEHKCVFSKIMSYMHKLFI